MKRLEKVAKQVPPEDDEWPVWLKIVVGICFWVSIIGGQIHAGHH